MVRFDENVEGDFLLKRKKIIHKLTKLNHTIRENTCLQIDSDRYFNIGLQRQNRNVSWRNYDSFKMKESRNFYLFSEIISLRRQPFLAQNKNGRKTESPVIYAQKCTQH